MRKVIQHESKTYLAPMPVVEKPVFPKYDSRIHDGQSIALDLMNTLNSYNNWKSSWIECTGFEIGQEVEEGEWEMKHEAVFTGTVNKVAIPKQQPEREEEYISNLDQTFGRLVINSMSDLGLHKEYLSQKIGFPVGVMESIISDEIYTNCIPIRLTEKLLNLLCIDFEEARVAVLNTYTLLKKNESPHRWEENPYAQLWENEEALNKYIKRLRELMLPTHTKE